MTPALWKDQNGLVHIGPDDDEWNSYTFCTSRGFVHRTKSMWRVADTEWFATCLMCLGYRRDDVR
jgi:hypothetical protein